MTSTRKVAMHTMAVRAGLQVESASAGCGQPGTSSSIAKYFVLTLLQLHSGSDVVYAMRYVPHMFGCANAITLCRACIRSPCRTVGRTLSCFSLHITAVRAVCMRHYHCHIDPDVVKLDVH